MINLHQGIVDDDGKLVGVNTVGPTDHEITGGAGYLFVGYSGATVGKDYGFIVGGRMET
ncbi:MAG: hypothetical protein NVSMB42_14870 [Herpetosiphon sp.]